MLLLLLPLLASADEPFDPLDPFAGRAPPGAVAAEPALADPILAVLDADVARWSAEADAASASLRERLAAWLVGRGEGEAVSAAATRLGTVLQVLGARVRLAEARLHELGVELDPPRDARLQAAGAIAMARVRDGLEPLAAARLRRVDDHIRRGRPEAAMTEAEALVARLDDLQAFVGPDVRVDAARLTLVRLATALGHPARARSWAASCAALCSTPEARATAATLGEEAATRAPGQTGEGVDPLADLSDGDAISGDGPAPAPPPSPRPDRHRAWATASVVLPLGVGRFEGVEVRRGVSGSLDLGYAPSELACVTVRGAIDAWRVPEHPGDVDLLRGRVELGWCPWLGGWTTGGVTLGLRPVGGVGVSFGRATEAEADQRLVGLGIHVRLEAPLILGAVALVPAIGAAPYGRGTDFGLGTSRSRFVFMDRVYGSIGVEIGLR